MLLVIPFNELREDNSAFAEPQLRACELPSREDLNLRRKQVAETRCIAARQGKQYRIQLWIFLGDFWRLNSSDALNSSGLIFVGRARWIGEARPQA